MNKFLKEFKDRGYFYQCTNDEDLEKLLIKEKIKAYIGFDCTWKSSCWQLTSNHVFKTFTKTRSSTYSVIGWRNHSNW